MLYNSPRDFEIWDYYAGHQQLLIRSTKKLPSETNLDIVFWAVEYLCIPPFFKGIAIRFASADESRKIEQATGKRPKCPVIAIDSGCSPSLVSALGFVVREHSLEIYESTIVRPGVSKPRSYYGTVLAYFSAGKDITEYHK